MKKILALILALALTLSLAACGSSAPQQSAAPQQTEETSSPEEQNTAPAETFTFRMGHSQAADHPFNDTCEYFAKLVNEKTNGAVTINVFPNSQLGDEATMLESVSMGTLDFLMANGANTAAYVPELGFLGTCFLFDSTDHLVAVTEDEQVNQIYSDIVASKDLGISLLCLMGNGMRYLYTATPVSSLDDLKGLKIRVMPSAVDNLVWTELGATATTVAFSEVYSALQTKMVDGAENTFSSYAASKHYEVAPYVTMTEHQWLVTELWASDATLAKLPAEYVDAIYEAAMETSSYSLQHQLEVDAAYQEELEAAGVTFIDIDTQPWKDVVQPLHEGIAADLGCTEVLNRINDLR